MTQLFKLFGIAAVSFLALDFIWLLLIARKLYQNYLGDLMGQTRIIPAALFYLMYLIGILFFVVYPTLEKESVLYALVAGGFLGLLCYGTYDLTNLATLKDWPVTITIIDLIWGTFVTGAVSGITVYLAQTLHWR